METTLELSWEMRERSTDCFDWSSLRIVAAASITFCATPELVMASMIDSGTSRTRRRYQTAWGVVKTSYYRIMTDDESSRVSSFSHGHDVVELNQAGRRSSDEENGVTWFRLSLVEL